MFYDARISQWTTADPVERGNIFIALKGINKEVHPYLPSGMVMGYGHNRIQLLFQLLDDVRIDTLTEKGIFFYIPGSFVTLRGLEGVEITTLPTLRIPRCYIISSSELAYYNKQITV